MGLNLEEVRKIATLARLRLTPEEEAVFVGQLAKIVDYIDQIQRHETKTGIEAVPEGREAEDRPHECLPREPFLANAPAAVDGFLLVPRVKGGGGGHDA